MKTSIKKIWVAFVITAALFVIGVTNLDRFSGKALFFISYVIGLPFLLAPLILLADWSTARKNRKLEKETKANNKGIDAHD
ncbi:MAG: hypothetical protein GXY61_12090 [Lentisphaerae bacterium]|jgi:hypothetical protein|nr:hypothetical protein [Lentisphaerota bacterium]